MATAWEFRKQDLTLLALLAAAVLIFTTSGCTPSKNQPPKADAGQDRVVVLEAGHGSVAVTLDGRASSDPDGTITTYRWTGTPDPDDMVAPVVTLKQGHYSFNLRVVDDDGAESASDTVKITVIGPPLIAPLPPITNAASSPGASSRVSAIVATNPHTRVVSRSPGGSSVPIKGVALQDAAIVVTNKSTNETREIDNPDGYFQIDLELTAGLNEIEVFAEINGVRSPSVQLETTCVETAELFLDDISPASGQIGTIVTLAGSGFTADPKMMGVYFKGADFESKGVVIEASADELKAVVPFIFFNTEEDLEVWVFEGEKVSNPITFHVVPAQDPTPDIQGNEVDLQLGLILTQVQNVFDKLELWTKPNVPPETWSALEENLHRLQDFLETLQERLADIPDENVRAYLDAVFGSEYFTIVDQKLEEANDILSHTTPCDINEVLEILSDALAPIYIINDILDAAIDGLYAALVGDSIACFFGCVPCCAFIPVIYQTISTVEAIDAVINAILSVVDTVMDVLRTGIPTMPSEWKVAFSGPFPGISNHILYTGTTNELSVYANFTNSGFEELLKDNIELNIGIPDPFGVLWIVKEITGVDVEAMIEDALGDLLLELAIDLLDIDEIHITFTDTLVSSTVTDTEPASPLTVTGEGVGAETHTIVAGSLIGTTELDIQAACGAFQYPHRTKCEQMVGDICVLWGSDYPEYFPVEVIDVPVIESWHWEPVTVWGPMGQYVRYDLKVEGKGFSGSFGRFKVYWNDDYLFTGANAGPNSFDVTGYSDGHKPGWLKVAVVDTNGNRRESAPVYIPNSPDLDVYMSIKNPSVFPGDTVYAVGNYFTSYPADNLLSLSHDGGIQAQINPYQVWWDTPATWYDVLAFEIPDLRAFNDTEFLATLRVGYSPYFTSQQTSLKLLPFESAGTAGADDQDLMVFSARNAYIRSTEIGDVNGDGINDLVIGVPSAGRDAGHPVGAVYIKFGPVEGVDLQYGDVLREAVDLSGDWDVKIWGDINDVHDGGNSRRIGKSLAIGDVNGDGIKDLIIGTSDRNDDDQHRADIDFGYTTEPAHLPGKAYVIYGGPQWQSRYLLYQGGYDVMFYGDDDRELGFQVGTCRIYGQARDDLVITAPADALNNLTSRVYVIGGWQRVLAKKDIHLPDDLNAFSHHAIIEDKNYYQHDPLTNTKYFGSGLGKALAIGDINGDGLDDIVLGAPDYSQDWSYNPWTGLQGAVYIFYGSSSLEGIFKVDAKTNSGGDYTAVWGARTRAVNDITRFGTAVALADINGDGRCELIVGAPAARLELRIRPNMLLNESFQSIAEIEEPGIGRIYIFNGDNPELGQPKTTADYDADVVVNGSLSISRFGYALATGDINADGITDLLVGAPGRNQGRGHVWVLNGDPSPFWSETEGQDLVQLQNRGRYNGYPGHFRDIDYDFYAPAALEDGTDYLFIGPDPEPVDLPGFGAFVTAGRLDPLAGDDVAVIDPAADAPGGASKSGLLHVFYQGTVPYLTISPDTAVLDGCSGQLTFTVQGGVPPYQFRWHECYRTFIGNLCMQGLPEEFAVQYAGNQVQLTLDQCVDSNLTRLQLVVGDTAGNEAYSWIDMVPTQSQQPIIDVQPDSLEFVINPEWNVTNTVQVTNEGAAELAISNVNLAGSADFYLWDPEDACGDTLAPGEACSIGVGFSRANEGTSTATLTITSNDPDNPVVEIPLTGTAATPTEPDITVIGANAVFGGVPIGSTRTQDIIVRNDGSTDLHVTGVTVSGAAEFALVSNGCTEPVPPFSGSMSQLCYITVSFTPTGTDPVYGQIEIRSDDPDEPVITGHLSGAGTSSFIYVNPLSLGLGETDTEGGFAVENMSSTETLDWIISDDLPGWLSVSPMGGQVAPGASTSVTVTVDRTGLDPGAYSHPVLITSNGGDEAVTVEMTVPVPPPARAAFATAYGGTSDDEFSSVRPTPDGGFIAAGRTKSFGAGNTDAWVVKLDASGYVQWEKAYGGTNDDRAYTAIPTSDGGYAVVGGTWSWKVGNWCSLWVFKLNADGSIAWQKTYGGRITDYDDHWEIAETQDHDGFVVAGNRATGDDGWILRLDSSGEPIWQYAIGSDKMDMLLSVCPTSDGGTVTAGVTCAPQDSWCDVLVVKLDAAGNIEWQKTYGGTAYDHAWSVRQTTDGGYVVAGLTDSYTNGSRSLWVLKLASDGGPVWQKSYGLPGTYAEGFSVQPDEEGSYLVGGRIGAGGDMDACLLKLDHDGDVVWSRTYGGAEQEQVFAAQTLTGGEVTVAAGFTASFGTGNWDAWLLRMDSVGNIGLDCALAGYADDFTVTDTDASVADAGLTVQATTAVPLNTEATVRSTSAGVSTQCSQHLYNKPPELIDIAVDQTQIDFGKLDPEIIALGCVKNPRCQVPAPLSHRHPPESDPGAFQPDSQPPGVVCSENESKASTGKFSDLRQNRRIEL